MTTEKVPCVVVVTGGAGFLGQHIVGLLQEHASHVTEIRVLDVIPYVNKLDYKERTPVQAYVGSITDCNLVNDACKGANCVMHIASIVDTRLLPDKDLSYNINVKGTENVISACRKYGVGRLIYCSSIEVVQGKENIYGGNEDNTQPREHGHMFEIYGHTKMKAEHLVLQANCDTLRTVSLRPVVMYGELEFRAWGRIVNNFVTQRTGKYFRLKCGDAEMEHAYVGNVAWGFLCAEKVLHKNDEKAKTASGKGYFISDDSPNKAFFDFMAPFLAEVGLQPFSLEIPLFLILYPLYFLSIILSLVSFIHKFNLPFGMASFAVTTKVFQFQYGNATKYLEYRPLYSFAEARARTVKFFKNLHVKKMIKRL